MNKTKHEFAFFSDTVAQLVQPGQNYSITDQELINRINVVLRLDKDDLLILFNQTHNVRCVIVAISKKSITVQVITRENNSILQPHITWLLPLLEREAFEDAITSLTVMGIQEVYPIITEKSRKSWGNEKERDRLQRIMKAACEQSKQFCMPHMHETRTFDTVKKIISEHKHVLFFDPAGQSAYDVINTFKQQNITSIICCVGPEGDLTECEKEVLKEAGALFCALTPTILRASVAVQIGAGLVRSCL